MRCKICNAKLASRSQSDKRHISYLCQPCYSSPTLEERCTALNNKKERCSNRASPKSNNNYCSQHSKLKGNI